MCTVVEREERADGTGTTPTAAEASQLGLAPAQAEAGQIVRLNGDCGTLRLTLYRRGFFMCKTFNPSYRHTVIPYHINLTDVISY